MKIKNLYKIFQANSIIATDTRKIIPKSLFFALKGENFDANQFLDQALEKGASYVILDNENYMREDSRYILVDDVLKTLQNLAKYHRKKLRIPIIALTGSNGKTTTKELINAVLSTKFQTTATQGNLNNHIGVPLTLLKMTTETEIGIVEMGANHFDEIAFLCEIAQPNYGYITNFGKAHLEGFGSLKGVVKAKSELYTYLKKNKGIAFVSQLDSKQMEITKKQKRHIIANDIKIENSDTFVKLLYKGVPVISQLIGYYNYSNIAAAIGLGAYFNVPERQIIKAIEAYQPTNKRSQLIVKGTSKIVLDAYNANPTSMEAALKNFKNYKALKKIVVLGDMFELGKTADKEHKQIALLAKKYDFDALYLIGEKFYNAVEKTPKVYINYKDFERSFIKSDFKNASILIKASRGMALERIVNLFD